jgi:hypothetical protein
MIHGQLCSFADNYHYKNIRKCTNTACSKSLSVENHHICAPQGGAAGKPPHHAVVVVVAVAAPAEAGAFAVVPLELDPRQDVEAGQI